MIELHKKDNLSRLSLYELIRVLLREYMTVLRIFPILYCPKTQHLSISRYFSFANGSSILCLSKNTKAAKVGK